MTENVTQMDDFLKTQIENLERKNRREEQRNEHLRQELDYVQR
jgi:chaperonin cofactor prefoldin